MESINERAADQARGEMDGTTYYDENEGFGEMRDLATGIPYDNVSGVDHPLIDTSTKLEPESEEALNAAIKKYEKLEPLSPEEQALLKSKNIL